MSFMDRTKDLWAGVNARSGVWSLWPVMCLQWIAGRLCRNIKYSGISLSKNKADEQEHRDTAGQTHDRLKKI